MDVGEISEAEAGIGLQEDRRLRELQRKKEYVAKQQRWLVFLRHCAKCQAAEGQCTYGQSCTVAKQLWSHMLTCADPNCKYPRCSTAGYRVLPVVADIVKVIVMGHNSQSSFNGALLAVTCKRISSTKSTACVFWRHICCLCWQGRFLCYLVLLRDSLVTRAGA